MLKFIKHNMETIDGIAAFPVFSFLVFFIFFIVLFVWVFRMRRNEVEEMALLPFEDGEEMDNNDNKLP